MYTETLLFGGCQATQEIAGNSENSPYLRPCQNIKKNFFQDSSYLIRCYRVQDSKRFEQIQLPRFEQIELPAKLLFYFL